MVCFSVDGGVLCIIVVIVVVIDVEIASVIIDEFGLFIDIVIVIAIVIISLAFILLEGADWLLPRYVALLFNIAVTIVAIVIAHQTINIVGFIRRHHYI